DGSLSSCSCRESKRQALAALSRAASLSPLLGHPELLASPCLLRAVRFPIRRATSCGAEISVGRSGSASVKGNQGAALMHIGRLITTTITRGQGNEQKGCVRNSSEYIVPVPELATPVLKFALPCHTSARELDEAESRRRVRSHSNARMMPGPTSLFGISS